MFRAKWVTGRVTFWGHLLTLLPFFILSKTLKKDSMSSCFRWALMSPITRSYLTPIFPASHFPTLTVAFSAACWLTAEKWQIPKDRAPSPIASLVCECPYRIMNISCELRNVIRADKRHNKLRATFFLIYCMGFIKLTFCLLFYSKKLNQKYIYMVT